MNSLKLVIMWCFILCVVGALLYRPHGFEALEPFRKNGITPEKVDRVQKYVGEELIIVGLLMVGGAITMGSAAKKAASRKSLSGRTEPPQEDAKPSAEPPLLVLTDEKGKYVI